MPSTRTQQALARLADLTPRQIAAELDRYIVGQAEAKKAVAIAIRNRWRRQRAPEAMRDEISSNNIILIGPTGIGKTEIARRLAKLASAPFIKVEASKFTEVGYVGRDVESMVRELVESAIDMVRTEREAEVEDLANERVDERLLDLLLPAAAASGTNGATSTAAAASRPQPVAAGPAAHESDAGAGVFVVSATGSVVHDHGVVERAHDSTVGELGDGDAADHDRYRRTREKLKQLLIDGQLDQREVEVEVEQRAPTFDMLASQGAPDGVDAFGEWLREMMPKRKKK